MIHLYSKYLNAINSFLYLRHLLQRTVQSYGLFVALTEPPPFYRPFCRRRFNLWKKKQYLHDETPPLPIPHTLDIFCRVADLDRTPTPELKMSGRMDLTRKDVADLFNSMKDALVQLSTISRQYHNPELPRLCGRCGKAFPYKQFSTHRHYYHRLTQWSMDPEYFLLMRDLRELIAINEEEIL